MQIQVYPEKLTLSPDLNDQQIVTNEYVDDIINFLKQEFLHSNNSNYVITGYRGTGKTALINRLDNSLKEEVLFVRLNFTKSENISMIFRQMFRELYLSLEKSKLLENSKKISKNDKQNLINKMRLLYDQTFFEITTFSNVSELSDYSLNQNFNVGKFIKKLLPALAVLLSSFNIGYNFTDFSNENSKMILLFGSLVWLTINNLDFNLMRKKTQISLNEKTRKSLYDNEIAEHHLKDILTQLNKAEIKTVFVIDELDKIEKASEMENMISKLKPLLLSNLAFFVIISGQKLYYKVLNSDLNDDSILSTIFSKSLHIPLANKHELSSIFNKFLGSESSIEQKYIDDYFNSLVLNSNKTIRKFIALLSEEIYKTDSKINEVLDKIIEQDIDMLTHDESVRDFLTYQLYIWIKRMKLKGSNHFTMEEIVSLESFSNDYPEWLNYELIDLSHKLLEKLDSEFLLAKISNQDKYKWNNQVILFQSNSRNNLISFLKLCVSIEEAFFRILRNLKVIDKNKTLSLAEMINLLKGNDMLLLNFHLDYDKISCLQSKIKQKQYINSEELYNIKQYTLTMLAVKFDVQKRYTFYVIDNYLKKFNYSLQAPKTGLLYQFEKIAVNEEYDLLIKVIYFDNTNNLLLRQNKGVSGFSRNSFLLIIFLIVIFDDGTTT